MTIVWWIILIIALPILFALVSWFWEFVTGIVMAIAGGMGYGVGKFLKIAPRDPVAAKFWFNSAGLLGTVISLSLSVWVLTMAFTWLFEIGWIMAIRDGAGAVWFFALMADFICLFFVGLIAGKIEHSSNLS